MTLFTDRALAQPAHSKRQTSLPAPVLHRLVPESCHLKQDHLPEEREKSLANADGSKTEISSNTHCFRSASLLVALAS